MSCPDLHRLIQDRLDGTLPDPETRLLETHLADCAGCREEEARLRELLTSLKQLPAESEPARDLWPALRARLEASSAAARVADRGSGRRARRFAETPLRPANTWAARSSTARVQARALGAANATTGSTATAGPMS